MTLETSVSVQVAVLVSSYETMAHDVATGCFDAKSLDIEVSDRPIGLKRLDSLCVLRSGRR